MKSQNLLLIIALITLVVGAIWTDWYYTKLTSQAPTTKTGLISMSIETYFDESRNKWCATVDLGWVKASFFDDEKDKATEQAENFLFNFQK